MNSKTPKFDKAIEKVLAELKPRDVDCKNCGQSFHVGEEDIELLKLFKAPAPTLCPFCRDQRRLAQRVRTPRFFKKKCSVPGHDETVLSFYSAENPAKVYDNEFWLSDGWGGAEFAIDLKVEEPFFEQFKKLNLNVPQQPLFQGPDNVNSEYTNASTQAKNCYFIGGPIRSEDCSYGFLAAYSLNCWDINEVIKCESCYECIACEECFNCKFCFRSTNCIDSWFLYDCKNCSNCFGSSNLRNKKYCWFNEQLTKEEYEKRLAQVNLGSYKVLQDYKDKFDDLYKNATHKHLDNLQTENSLGDMLRGTRNVHLGFWVIGETDHVRYAFYGQHMKDCMDVSGAISSEKVYESSGLLTCTDVKFSYGIRAGTDLEYCASCNDCSDCFGCVGLKSKKFHIFNKPYSEEEYWKKVDEIKTAMLGKGEYGEFFLISSSLHPYNNTDAQLHYPLDKAGVEKVGSFWEEEKPPADLTGLNSIHAKDLPDDIKDVDDSLLKKAIVCEVTGKPFRIIKPELEFYRSKGLSLPRIHPFERLMVRFRKINPFKLWKDKCRKCQKEVDTSYNPDKKLKVYCEACYNQEVL